jgi:hypothetical protein
MRRYGKSRREQLERAALHPLPAARFEYADCSKGGVNIDYHLAVDGHFYSVRIDSRITRSRRAQGLTRRRRPLSEIRTKPVDQGGTSQSGDAGTWRLESSAAFSSD